MKAQKWATHFTMCYHFSIWVLGVQDFVTSSANGRRLVSQSTGACFPFHKCIWIESTASTAAGLNVPLRISQTKKDWAMVQATHFSLQSLKFTQLTFAHLFKPERGANLYVGAFLSVLPGAASTLIVLHSTSTVQSVLFGLTVMKLLICSKKGHCICERQWDSHAIYQRRVVAKFSGKKHICYKRCTTLITPMILKTVVLSCVS